MFGPPPAEPSSIQLRDYQASALEKLRDGLRRGVRRQMLCLGTGGGKTIVAAALMQYAADKGKRAAFVADRITLVDQTSTRLREAGIDHGVAQGQNRWGYENPVHVWSSQTLERAFQHRDVLADYDLLVIDEAHIVRRLVVEKMIESDIPTIGLSATPFTKGLGDIYQALVNVRTTDQLVADKWLVPFRIFVGVAIDMKGAKLQGGEWSDAEVSTRTLPVIGDIVAEWREKTHEVFGEGRNPKTLVFSASVANGQEICRAFGDIGIMAEQISYRDRDDEERRAKIRRFEGGETDVLTAVDALCLSEDTEVLTARGWQGPTTVTMDDSIAQFHPSTGGIDFQRPSKITRRMVRSREQWVTQRSAKFKVTGNHRMLVGHRGWPTWKEMRAIDLVGKSRQIPLCGDARPLPVATPTPERPKSSLAVRIRGASYHLRKTHGFTSAASKDEARRRILERDAMTYTPVESLSTDECAFIGFWIGDGSRKGDPRGGVVYTLTQSMRYPHIVEWVDLLLERLAIPHRRRMIPQRGNMTAPAVTWRFARGTGYGPQKMGGLFHLEAWLTKSGGAWMMGLNHDQFDALIEGFNYADGLHDQPRRHGYRITNANTALLDWLQAVAVCRGWKASITRNKPGGPNHRPRFHISMRRHKYRMTIGRGKPVVANTAAPGEQAWCVTVPSGWIVTRRDGVVTILGNSKGFDVPMVECIVMARPFRRSLSQIIQQLGRGMRIADDKEPFCLLLDCARNYLRFADRIESFWANGLPNLHSKTLEKQREPSTKEAEERVCPECGFVWPKGADMCPSCGHKPAKKAREATQPGTLVEYKRSGITRDIWPDCCAYARDRHPADDERAKKHALVQYKEIMGRWPQYGRAFEPAEACDPEIAAMIRKNISDYIRRNAWRKKKPA